MTSTHCDNVIGTAEEFKVSVEQLHEQEWNALLPQFDDANIYQTWAYGAVRWRASQLNHVLLRSSGKLVAIVQIRVVTLPILKIGVAYVRWGPLWRRGGRNPDPAVILRMSQALYDEYVLRRGLVLRIIPMCFQGDAIAESLTQCGVRCGLKIDPAGTAYRTFRLDLAPPLDDLRRRFDPKWRNKLNGAERNGLTVVQGTADAYYEEFLNLYTEMMRRKKFETTVDVTQFRDIQKRLDSSIKMQTFLCQRDGRTLNALVVSALGDTGIYLLGATGDEGTKAKGSYLLHWSAIQWLKERGVRWYDLGGINPIKNPGVYEFKEGFSGAEYMQLGRLVSQQRSLSKLIVAFGERLSELKKRG